MTSAILIPMKEPGQVKTRLARLLTLAERQQLAWAMFEDVCRAVADVTKADAVFLVTSYKRAVEEGRRCGFDALVEDEQRSESASVDAASRLLYERGFTAVLRLPADIPLVRGDDIDHLLAIDRTAPAALLVPSFDGTGTNALLRTPPDLFASCFGPDSFRLHREAAAQAGVEITIIENQRIALDIDEPQDIEKLWHSGQGTNAFRILQEVGVMDRL